MEEDTELEEGEASLAFVSARESFDDPDFSYIDEKLQNLLGEQQKQFLTAGGVDAVQLGSKYGGYGSFLPTQVRRPSVLASKPPLSDSARARQPLTEGHGENAKPIASTTTVVRGVPENAPKGSSGTNGFTGSAGRAMGAIDQADSKKLTPLTLRIKMGCKEKEVPRRAVADFCQNELGLGPLSSQSAGEDYGALLSSDAESSPDRSPMSMIRAMTSHHIPGGGLLSPLTQTLDSESARVRLTEASDKRMKSRPTCEAELCSIALALDDLEARVMTNKKSKTSSHSLGRPGRKDGLDGMRTHTKVSTPDAGESESRESLYTSKVDCVESVSVRKYSSGGTENNDVEETSGSKRRDSFGAFDARKYEKKDISTGKYEKMNGSLSGRADSKSEKQSHSADSNREYPKSIFKESGLAEKNRKGWSSSLQETTRTALKGANRDGESNLDRVVFGEPVKPETKRQPVAALEELKGTSCSSLGISSQKQMTSSVIGHDDGKSREYIEKADKGKGLSRDKKAKDFGKDSRKVSGLERKEISGKAAIRPRKDGDSARGLQIASGKEDQGRKDVQGGTRRKSKVSAGKGAVVAKPMSKDLVAEVLKQTSNDHSTKGVEAKQFDSLSDMNVKRMSSLKDVCLNASRQKEVAGSLAHEVHQDVTDRTRRDQAEMVRVRESVRESKPKKRTSKEQTSTASRDKEVPGRGRESSSRAAEFAVSDYTNKASCSAEPLTQPVIAGTDAGLPPLSNAVVVHEDWVLCDTCSKWRLCVPWIKVDELPKKWRCKIMTWLPNMNNCKYSEDETTAAVYQLLGVPPPVQGGQFDSGPAAQRATGLSTTVDPPTSTEELKGTKVNKAGCVKKVTRKAFPAANPLPPSLNKADGSTVKCKSLNAVVKQPQDYPSVNLASLPKKGELSTLAVCPDIRKEKLKRVRGSEGEDSRPMKQLANEEKFTVFMVEDTDSSCKNGAERNGGQVCGDAMLSTRHKQSSLWEDEVNILNLQDGQCEARDSETRAAAKDKGYVLKCGNDVKQRNMSKRKQEGSEHPEEFQRRKKLRTDHVNEPWLVEHSEGAGRPQEYASLANGCPEDDNWKNRSGTYTKPSVNRMRAKEFSKSSKQVERGIGVSKLSKQAGNYQSTSMLEVVGATDKDPDFDEQNGGTDRETLGAKSCKGKFGLPGQDTQGKEEGSESELKTGKKRKVPKRETRDTCLKKGSKKKNILTSDQEMILGSTYTRHPFYEDDRTAEDRSQNVTGRVVHGLAGVDRSIPLKPPAGIVEVDGQGVSTSTNLRFSKLSSSKSSESMSRGRGSPIESTVSSSPLRSPKTGEGHLGRTSSQGLELPINMMGSHYTASMRHSHSVSPKRSLDRDGDAQSERSGPLGQSHRPWDDRPRSSEHDHEFRGSNRDNSSDRGREDRYPSMKGGDVFRRSRNVRDDDHYWGDHRDGRGASGGYFPGYDRVHEDRYREREGSLDRYREVVRDGRYERHKTREDRLRERDRDRDRERDRDRVRENWVTDKGDGRDERYSRDRITREDWVRPSSRESRLDKLVGSNWIEEGRSTREQLREERRSDGRERPEDGSSDVKQDMKLKSPREGRDLGQPDVDGNTLQLSSDAKSIRDLQRQEKINGKTGSAWQAASPFRGGMNWEGDRRPSRKDRDGGSMRNVPDALPSADSRNTVEVQESGAVVRAKCAGQCDNPAVDTLKRVREHGRGIEDAVQPRKVLNAKAVAGSNVLAGKDQDGSAAGHSREHAQAVNAANVATRDGKDLKHSADRLKHLGQEGDSTDLYLRAALKFLQAASMLEPVCADVAKLGEVTQSMNMYHDTAKLCEYCASSYERGGPRNLPAAALAYKCAAVAHMRVLMAKNLCFTRDHQQLHAALQSSSLGVNQTAQMGTMHTAPVYNGTENAPIPASNGVDESPSSSSASDVDNLNVNNQNGVGDKGPFIEKGSAADIPLPMSVVSNGFSIPAHLQQSFTRLLRDASDISASLDALSKAATATAAADLACAGNPAKLEAMTAVKRVGEDSGFGDVDHIVRLVRLALEAIEH